MKIRSVIAAGLLAATSLWSATPDNHPAWKSTRLPGLYYEVLAASIPQEAALQAPDGHFRARLPGSPVEDERGFSMYNQQYIYVPALLYVTDNPANPLRGDKKLLKMAEAAGDYMAGSVTDEGEFEPKVNGNPVNGLDAHRALYCWAEAYGLLKNDLGPAREKSWREAILRAGGLLAADVASHRDRPRYSAPFLGTSPNHFGLWTCTVLRIGMLLDKPEWVDLARPVLARFVREVAPGGYWAEHDGPTMNYDYLNSSVAGLYWFFSQDPAALRAMRLSTDFHMHWTTPDGVDIHTVDERNRNSFRVNAGWGLFTFCNFPEGRRYARFKLLAALGEGHDPLKSLSLESLARLAQDAQYHTEGEEAPIPQDSSAYSFRLDRPAVVTKSGPWVYSICAMLSPRSPYNQFFLDRTCPVSLWHSGCNQIIGGGNSKDQPGLATFAVKRSAEVWDYMPLDAFLSAPGGPDTLCMALEGFSLRLVIRPVDGSTALICAQAQRTYNTADTVYLNLPLILEPGGSVSGHGGFSMTLDKTDQKVTGKELGGVLAYGKWRLNLPAEAVFTWPFYTYSPYGPVRVPKNIRSAVGQLSVPLDPEGKWLTLRLDVTGE